MDAVEFIKERNRMCESFDDDCDCSNCPAYRNNCCNTFEWQEELVAIVEKWSIEHPRKTRQDAFLKQWPNVKWSKTEPIIDIRPCIIDQTVRTEYPCSKDCDDCCREFWLQEIE
mgnify:FL=1